MLTPYIVYFTFITPGAKKPGPVKQFRVYAGDWEEARRVADKQSSYPDIEVLRVVPA
ncbi:MAG: hypothetical protein ACE5E5_11215 [Phycisphaerae bacterium]